MPDKTALAESAQALFCAFADYVGLAKMKKQFTLQQYPTYSELKSEPKNKILIKESFNRTNLIGVTLPQIESFLKDTSWYESSVLIAVKLLDKIKTIAPGFGKIQGSDWQRLFYSRGAKSGDSVMNDIDDLFKFANDDDRKFGDINKWSPADIYFVSKKARKIIGTELQEAQKDKKYTFLQLNTICNKLIKSGDLLPLSLKKVISGQPMIVKYNFNRTKEEKNLAELIYIMVKKSKTLRDIQIFFKDGKSQLKIRHDPHHTKFGANSALKCEIIVQGMGGRLGSIGSMKILLEVIKEASCKKSAAKFHTELQKSWNKGWQAYKKGIDKLNKNSGVKATDPHSKLEKQKLRDGTTRYDQYKTKRAELSQKTLMASIIPVIENYFTKHSKSKKIFSDSTLMLHAFVKYASSRSPQSGKFVIAK